VFHQLWQQIEGWRMFVPGLAHTSYSAKWTLQKICVCVFISNIHYWNAPNIQNSKTSYSKVALAPQVSPGAVMLCKTVRSEHVWGRGEVHTEFEKNKKVKFSRYRPGVAQRVGRGIALLFHDRDPRRGWVVSSTPRPHLTPGKDPVPILQEAGWASGPVWTGGNSRPHRD
jgi:hypothetical protein